MFTNSNTFSMNKSFPHQNVYDTRHGKTIKRLAGGADKNIGNNEDNLPIDTAITLTVPSTANTNDLNVFSNKFPSNRPSNTVDYTDNMESIEVGEIINNAMENIESVSNELTTLATNHQDELKTLFMEISTYLQRCIDAIQARLNLTKTMLKSLQFKLSIKEIEVRAKNYQLADLKNKLSKCQEQMTKAILKETTETSVAAVTEQLVAPLEINSRSTPTIQSITPSVPSQEIAVHTTSPQKMTIYTVSSSYEVGGVESMVEQRGTSHSMIVTIEPSTDMPTNAPDQIDHMTISGMTARTTLEQPHHVALNVLPEIPEIASVDDVSRIALNESQTQQTATKSNSEHKERTRSKSLASGISSTTTQAGSASRPAIFSKRPQRSEVVSSQSSTHAIRDQPILSSTSALYLEKPEVPTCEPILNHNQIAMTLRHVGIQSFGDPIQPHGFPGVVQIHDQEKDKLMTELLELRKENKQLKRDRLNYENSVQRALIRGMSSLNSETMKVLPNPLLMCYTPCVPCDSYYLSSTSSHATNIPDGQMEEINREFNTYEAATQSKISSKNFCYSTKSTKTCSQNNMIFLMPHKKKNNACISIPQFYVNAENVETRNTVCQGRICRSNNHRNFCNCDNYNVSKISKDHNHSPITHDHFRGKYQDYIEATSCTKMVKASRRQRTDKVKRCTGCCKPTRRIEI